VADTVVKIDDGFWNVRGSFKVAGLIDIGTQVSLVRLSSGRFVFLDAYTLEGPVAREIDALTEGGKAVEAILNLHPFHTVHVRAMAERFPAARLYGTARHAARAPELRWEALRTEDPELHEQFADDFAFTVPRGVDFVPEDGRLHFASVLAFHPASRTLHVDDTLTWTNLPWVGGLMFHPTLRSVLQRRAGAAAEFRAWALDLVERCEQVDHLCTAHTRALPPAADRGSGVADRIRGALARADKTIAAHEQRYG
jgi:hypothetical protein